MPVAGPRAGVVGVRMMNSICGRIRAGWRGIALGLVMFCGGEGSSRGEDEPDLKALLGRMEALERKNKELGEELERVRASESSKSAELEKQVDALKERLESLEPPPEELPASPEPNPEPESPPAEPPREAPSRVPTGGEGPSVAGTAKGKKSPPKFMDGVWENGLRFKSEDDAFEFHLGGRMDFDNTWYRVDDNLRFGSNNDVRLHDGADFRRLRLRAEGRFYKRFEYVMEVNFANLQDFGNTGAGPRRLQVGSVGLTDVYLAARDVPVLGTVRVGHVRAPFGLEHITSANFWYYMERSPMFDAFVNRFNYVDGLWFSNAYLDDRATLTWSLFRSASSTINPFGSGSGAGEYGAAVRATALPIYEDDGERLVHLGISYLRRALDEDMTSPGTRPLVRAGAGNVEVPNVIQTGTFFAPDGVNYVNTEVAMVFGRLSLSSEYLFVYSPSTFTDAARPYARGPQFNHGFYVEGGYFLTKGDRRRYLHRNGSWDRTIPAENLSWSKGGKGLPRLEGTGAVQVLARYTYLDLLAGQPAISPVAGARAGQENDLTIGLNWYFNPNTFMMINYVRTWVDSASPGRSGAFDGLGIRFHYDF